MVSRRVKLNVISAYRPPGLNAEASFQQLDEVIDLVQGPNQTALCIVDNFNAKTSDDHNRLIQLVIIFNCSLLHVNSLRLSTVLLSVFVLPPRLFSISFF